MKEQRVGEEQEDEDKEHEDEDEDENDDKTIEEEVADHQMVLNPLLFEA